MVKGASQPAVASGADSLLSPTRQRSVPAVPAAGSLHGWRSANCSYSCCCGCSPPPTEFMAGPRTRSTRPTRPRSSPTTPGQACRCGWRACRRHRTANTTTTAAIPIAAYTDVVTEALANHRLILANHAMLLAHLDELGDLGDDTLLVLDEAHQLEDAATSALTTALDYSAVEDLFAELNGWLDENRGPAAVGRGRRRDAQSRHPARPRAVAEGRWPGVRRALGWRRHRHRIPRRHPRQPLYRHRRHTAGAHAGRPADPTSRRVPRYRRRPWRVPRLRTDDYGLLCRRATRVP